MEPSSNKPRAAYTSDVSDAEWDFCRPYLVLMKEDAPQRDYPLRELFNALRYIVRCGGQWRRETGSVCKKLTDRIDKIQSRRVFH